MYTEDLGVNEARFFEQASPNKYSPKNQRQVHFQSNLINRETQLMKKIS